MRERLGTHLTCAAVLVGVVLAGCGEESGRGSDGAGDGRPAFTEIAMISQTAVGGEKAAEPVVLDTEQARDEFAGRFSNARMGEAVDRAVSRADVPDGQTLVGAVVAIGCDVPDEVLVESTARGLQITAEEAASPTEECFAAMTTVALVAVDPSLV